MNSHRFNPGIIVAYLIIALVALLFSGCGSKQSAKNNSPAPSFFTPDVSALSRPEASSPVLPVAPTPKSPEPFPAPPSPELEAPPVSSRPEASSPVPPPAPSPEPPEPSPEPPEPPPPPPAPEPEPEPEPAPADPVSGSAEGEGFEVTITANPCEQITGGEIALILVVKNISGEEYPLTIPTSQQYDFVAYDTNGKAAWRWSNGKLFLMMIVEFLCEPYQSWSYIETWPTLGLPPGDYTLEGYFAGLPGVKPRVTISINSE